MSSGSQEKREEIIGKLTRELRQSTEIGVSFFRAVAARMGMTVTDMQVIDILDSGGPMTAGQLADLTRLTTGAITGMLNRLEKSGFVRRERDPNDARKVIVRLERGEDERSAISPIYDDMTKIWDDLASHYDDEQLTLLLEFLKRSNALSRKEISRLQEELPGAEEFFSTPLGDLENAHLIVSSAIARLLVRADDAMAELCQAQFEGTVPDVKVNEGIVTIRYPRSLPALLGVEKQKRAAEVTLNVAIPWQITIQGGAGEIIAELGKLDLAGLEVKGGGSMIRLELPVPSGVVPIRISGGGSEIIVRRPAGVAVRAHLEGWGSAFVFDEETHMGNKVWLQSSGFEPTAPYYNIEVASSGSMVTITSN